LPVIETRSASLIVVRMVLGWAGRILLAAGVALAAVYVGDFIVFTVRGNPMDQVVVSRYMAAPLKGNKTAYYFESSGPEPCAKAMFPQSGRSACWKLRKHPLVADQPN
jgi:hypothetical protein